MGDADAKQGRSARWRVHRVTAMVLAVGLAASGGLAAAAFTAHGGNEHRLLQERAREAGASLATGVPALQSGLNSAARLVKQTDGDESAFRVLFASITGGKRPFSSVSIWRADPVGARPLVVLGGAPVLARSPAAVVRASLNRTLHTKDLVVVPLLDSPTPAVGYAVASAGPGHRFVVYAETAVPRVRTSIVRKDSVFVGLGYAAYLAPREDSRFLLGASTSSVPIRGARATATVPYGDSSIFLVVTPTREQGGQLLNRLPWFILVVGALISVAFAALAERLLRLAEANAHLYAQQRSVAQTLQHNLLPHGVPAVPGLEIAVRYEPGVTGIEIGGDWYDVLPSDGPRVLMVVGDVSGRGLRAATIMGTLRHATRAYAAQGDGPAEILTRLNQLLDIVRDEHFATIACFEVDPSARTVTWANAGHPSPLLIDGLDAAFLQAPTGLPIGVVADAEYETATVTVPAGATLLAFTDGLFERRGESLDVGLERLRQSASRRALPLEQLLTTTCAELVEAGASDDTAVLGVRWVI